MIAYPEDEPSGAEIELTVVDAPAPLSPSERERRANERFRLGPEALPAPLSELDPAD